MTDWNKLLNDNRRKPKSASKDKPKLTLVTEKRTETERDYDRILFSTPTRRLADKTQVFPLEQNDSVRTRLTHSHEVANMARSIGINLSFDHNLKIPDRLKPKRNLPAMMSAIGLAHDLGNPPFGHQGENAIRKWFESNSKLLSPLKNDAMKNDFLKFEGNAQTLRLLTRLQLINDEYGLDLTYGTLAALMKYTVPSDKVKKKFVSKKKFGFFQSEKKIVKDIWNATGLSEGKRHPFTYIMEACDDIAYSVLDTEDSVKKGLVSFSDLMAYLKNFDDKDVAIQEVVERSKYDHDKYRKDLGLSPNELNDISMQKFRVYAIATMISCVTSEFIVHKDKVINGTLGKGLIDISKASALCEALKTFDIEHSFNHRSVLEVELSGYNTINSLMDILWRAIENRGDPKKVKLKDVAWETPFEAYSYSRISENYRRVFEDKTNKMPMRYKQLQLLTDMISGMTDSFAMNLLEELQEYEK